MAYISYAHICLMVVPLAVLLVTAAPAEKDVTECAGGHKINETWVTGKLCAEYLCLPDGSISATPCFPMQVGPRCKRVGESREGDKVAKFPECCDKVECVSDGEKHEKKEDKNKEEKH